MCWKKYENDNETLFVLENNKLDICIHKQNNINKWFLTCKKLGIVKKGLKNKDFNNVVKESQIIVISTANELYHFAVNFIKNVYDHNEFC